MPTHKNKLVCTSNPSQKVTRQNVQLSVTLDRTIGILRCEGIPQFLSNTKCVPVFRARDVSNPGGSRLAYSSQSRQVWVAPATVRTRVPPDQNSGGSTEETVGDVITAEHDRGRWRGDCRKSHLFQSIASHASRAETRPCTRSQSSRKEQD